MLTEDEDDLSIGFKLAMFVPDKALESSMAERLHDLARNSMDSVGVSGAAPDEGSHLAGPFSSIFSSFCVELFMLHATFHATKGGNGRIRR